MLPRLTRRRRLLLITGASAVAFDAVSSLVAVRGMRAAPTYRPGDDVEGVTDELARALPPDYPRVHVSDVTDVARISLQV